MEKIGLKPNHQLMNPEFEGKHKKYIFYYNISPNQNILSNDRIKYISHILTGYKLSLDPIPLYQGDFGNRKLGVRYVSFPI